MTSPNSGFFSLMTVDEARAALAAALGSEHTPPEPTTAGDALGRVLAEDVSSPDAVPHFSKSLVDGYAVRSADIAGATASLPAYLDLVGRVVMGRPPELRLGPGQAVEVPTGGMLPDEADAAVMVEHTERLGDATIEVSRPVAPGQNIIRQGEDVPAGQVCLPAHTRLRPGDLALLATLGVTQVQVFRQPAVALLSTGDEVVPPDAEPGLARVRDANAWGVAALIREAGADPCFHGIVQDSERELAHAARQALEGAEALIISGGSSVGERDFARRALDGLGRPGVLVHGVALKPGKPTILGVADGKPVFGLPGHPLSAIVSFHCLVRPFLRRLGGETDFWEPALPARLSRSVPSDAGRTEYVRVRLRREGAALVAEPLFGKSAGLTSLTMAHGFVEVPLGAEGLDAGALVAVLLF